MHTRAFRAVFPDLKDPLDTGALKDYVMKWSEISLHLKEAHVV
jgi:hypothetical protein